MADATFFVIDPMLIQIHFKHIALLSRGRDPLFDIPISNHLIEDVQFNIRYHLQIIQCINKSLRSQPCHSFQKTGTSLKIRPHLLLALLSPAFIYSSKKHKRSPYNL